MDDKLIKASDVKEHFKRVIFGADQKIDTWVDSIPAVDAVEVVRCRECKHKGWVQEPEHGKSVDYCRLIERCVDKQFFCAAGERKTNCGAKMDGRREDGDKV